MNIDNLTEPLTVDEVRESIYEILALLGVTTTNWKPGAVTRTMIAACAVLIASLSKLISLIARSGFLEHATGDWLTLLAEKVYGVSRERATFAAGSVTITNSGGGVYGPFEAESVTFVNSVSGAIYRNAEPFSIAMGPSTVDVAIRAVEAGSLSSATAGQITEMQPDLLGVTVVNTAAVIGTDDEPDPSLRLRCQEKLGALSPNGPADAYRFVARSARRADGSSVGVTRVRTVKDGQGNIDVYCATSTGGIEGDADDPGSDLGAVNEAIQRNAAPLSVTARVHSAEAVAIPVVYQAWIYNTSGLTETQIKEAIEDELLSFFESQPIGGNVIAPASGKVFRDAIQAVILRAHKPGTDDHLGIIRAVVSTPAVDTELTLSQVPVAGTITGTITQIPPPTGSV